MNEKAMQLLDLISYLPVIIALIQVPLIIWGISNIFKARKELIEKYRTERANLKKEIRQNINGE